MATDNAFWKDSLEDGFVMFPLVLLDMVAEKEVSSSAVHVLLLLLKHARKDSLEVWPSQETLAKALGTTHRGTVRKALRELTDVFGITTTKVKTKTGYYHRYDLAPLIKRVEEYSRNKKMGKPAPKPVEKVVAAPVVEAPPQPAPAPATILSLPMDPVALDLDVLQGSIATLGVIPLSLARHLSKLPPGTFETALKRGLDSGELATTEVEGETYVRSGTIYPEDVEQIKTCNALRREEEAAAAVAA